MTTLVRARLMHTPRDPFTEDDPLECFDDGYLDGTRLDALGVVPDAGALLSFIEGYEHPARKWTAVPPAR